MRRFSTPSSPRPSTAKSFHRKGRAAPALVAAILVAGLQGGLAHAATGAGVDADADGPVSAVTVQGKRDARHVPAAVGKTGTALEDLPASVQVIDADLVAQQGGVALKDAIHNASGVGQGGQDGFGFYDRFLVRGLDARIYSDGFSDGDQRNGIPHSMNGVERVEILKGPGSALFGSGPPGGTINIVHYAPSDTSGYGGSLQVGSFGAVSATAHLTGPTGIAGLDFRIDGLAQHTDGFRDLESKDLELRPELRWTGGQHVVTLSFDARRLEGTPDPAGLLYVHGAPIDTVPDTAKYSTPFSYGNQDLQRASVSDVWTPAPFVTVTNRFSYLHRDLKILRNGDGGAITGVSFTGRQLRKQHDKLDDYDYQFEPVWSFHTGPIGHTLLTGFEAQRQNLDTNRATADLPAIPDIFHPVTPETSEAGLTFLRDAKHSGAIDRLNATYRSLYAADQLDLTERLKLRLSLRKDWWDTDMTPQLFIPGRLQPTGQPFQQGVKISRDDAPTSWNVGLLYKLTPNISPFAGVSRSHLVVFSSESTQNGLAPPEAALQYEAGFKANGLSGRMTLTAAAFEVKRQNVFALVGDTPFFNDQETRGAEADLALQATDRWRVTANVTSQHAELTDNPSNPAITGKHPIGVPAHAANLWTSYDFSLDGLSGLRAGLGVSYRDKLYGNTLNTNAVPSFVTEDVVLSYLRDSWTLAVGVKNLADKTYYTAANGGGGLVAEPRTAFVSLSVREGG